MSNLIEYGDCREVVVKSHAKHSIDPNVFRKALLTWYDKNKRNLPWRSHAGEFSDPYKVWLSEVMLQQTTVKAVIPYYNRFLALWPTVFDLANASEGDVLREWAGLGYYSRARNLLKTAKMVVSDFGGKFPADKKVLLSLKGVGDYTASSIAAIAFSRAETVIDGNVERVVSRLVCFDASPKLKKREFTSVCRELSPSVSEERPGDYAQAIMDIASSVCLPKTPNCELCPLSFVCGSFARKSQSSFPVKTPKSAKKKKFACALLIVSDEGEAILLEKRSDEGMLAGTLGVPMTLWFDNQAELLECLSSYQLSIDEHLGSFRHVFTHIDLEVSFAFSHRRLVGLDGDVIWVSLRGLRPNDYPTLFSKILQRFLEIKS